MLKILSKINKFTQNHNNNKYKNFPTLFFFTDRNKFDNIFEVIKNLPKNSAVIIREYDLSYNDRLIFTKKIVQIAHANNLLIFAGKNIKLALEAKTNGVHFSDNDKSWQEYLLHKKSNPNFLLSCSCHNEASLIKTKKFDIEFTFLSPIFKTKSHPSIKPIGHRQLARIILKNKIKTYALGGVNEKNIALLNNIKILGIGSISLLKKL